MRHQAFKNFMKKLFVIHSFFFLFVTLIHPTTADTGKSKFSIPIVKPFENVDSLFAIESDSMVGKTMAERFVAFENYVKKTTPNAVMPPIYLSSEVAAFIPPSGNIEEKKEKVGNGPKPKRDSPQEVSMDMYLKLVCKLWTLRYQETEHGILISNAEGATPSPTK
jgi:hypothetical protein